MEGAMGKSMTLAGGWKTSRGLSSMLCRTANRWVKSPTLFAFVCRDDIFKQGRKHSWSCQSSERTEFQNTKRNASFKVGFQDNHSGQKEKTQEESVLAQALNFEAKSGYPNLEGKRFPTFHLYLIAELEAFEKMYKQERKESWPILEDLLQDLLRSARLYPQMEQLVRQGIVLQVRKFITLQKLWKEHSRIDSYSLSNHKHAEKARLATAPDVEAAPRGSSMKDMEGCNIFFFDLETTGLSPANDRIVEVAIIALHSGKQWTTLIDPECQIPHTISTITGITNETIQDANAPTFEQVAKQMVDFIHANSIDDSATLIAHNVRFDMRFLHAELVRCGESVPKNWYFYDSVKLAKEIISDGDVSSFKLQTLHQYFNYPPPAAAHRALSDVESLMQVFESILSRTTADTVLSLMKRHRISAKDLGPKQRIEKVDLPKNFKQIGITPKPDPLSSIDIIPATDIPFNGKEGSFIAVESSQRLHEKQLKFLTDGIPIEELKDFTPMQKGYVLDAGFKSLSCLLQYYPKDYLFYSPSLFKDDEHISSQGTVKSVSTFSTRNRGCIQAAIEVHDSDGTVHLVNVKQWIHFRSEFQASRAMRAIGPKYPVGSVVAFKGKLKERSSQESSWDLSGNIELTSLSNFTELEKEIHPIYVAKGTLKTSFFQKIIPKALSTFDKFIDCNEGIPQLEILPEHVVRNYNLMNYKQAMHAIHFPSSPSEIREARERLVFQELFLLQTALMLRRYQMQTPRNSIDARGINIGHSLLLEHAKSRLPYELTASQERVLGEILLDMSGLPPMMRLLQGDVGCGKTIVAMLAMLAAAGSGWQCALMVPTEILALQHAQKLQQFLESLNMDGIAEIPEVVVLTGSMRGSQKKEILNSIAEGRATFVIGTHALISEGVQFLKLGLAIIDEQHKFGVEQRSKLQSKNEPPPHLLAMSATPIPRTLALTLYGEMALSYVDEVPPGRAPVATRVFKQEDQYNRSNAYSKLKEEVQKGNKAFIVFPLIEESTDETQSIMAAEAAFQAFQENELKGIPCGMLHGRLQPLEKLAAQTNFVEGRTKVLVATAVVEVGVDIPEATVIIVENAERFGLAQLHQLRGRVGRSNRHSSCFLLTGGNETSHSRIKHMETLNNGFEVSEADMALRGPGEFLGTKQAGQNGLPTLQLTDLKSAEDRIILEKAREAAVTMFADGKSETSLQQSIALVLESQPPLPKLDIIPDVMQVE